MCRCFIWVLQIFPCICMDKGVRSNRLRLDRCLQYTMAGLCSQEDGLAADEIIARYASKGGAEGKSRFLLKYYNKIHEKPLNFAKQPLYNRVDLLYNDAVWGKIPHTRMLIMLHFVAIKIGGIYHVCKSCY